MYGGQYGCDGAPRPIYGTVTYNDPVYGPQTTMRITGYNPNRWFYVGGNILANDFKLHCPVTCGIQPAACPGCTTVGTHYHYNAATAQLTWTGPGPP